MLVIPNEQASMGEEQRRKKLTSCRLPGFLDDYPIKLPLLVDQALQVGRITGSKNRIGRSCFEALSLITGIAVACGVGATDATLGCAGLAAATLGCAFPSDEVV